MYSKADRPVNASFHIQVRSDTNDHMKDRKLDEIQLILCLNSFLTLEPFESAYVLVAVVSSLHRLPVWLRAIRRKQHPIWRLCQLKRQMDEREREGTLRSPSKWLHCRRNSPRLPEDVTATQTEADFLQLQQIIWFSFNSLATILMMIKQMCQKCVCASLLHVKTFCFSLPLWK